MANPEHLAKLKEGVKAWNEWKFVQGKDFVADLGDADFQEMELTGINLSCANLQKQNSNMPIYIRLIFVLPIAKRLFFPIMAISKKLLFPMPIFKKLF